MKQIITLFFLTLLSGNLNAQIYYLNLTGLSNSHALTNIPIASTGVTFNANISNSGSLPNPNVSSNGNINLSVAGSSKQCINLSFSSNVQFYITDNNLHSATLGPNDLVKINTSPLIEIDPSNRVFLTTTASGMIFIPSNNITNYTKWNLTTPVFITNIQVCGQRSNKPGGNGNYKVPLRLGIKVTTLPVELINFNLEKKENNTVQIDWTTVSESNNNFFTIERSFNGIDWDSINYVKGAGTSSTTIKYSSNDFNTHIGILYYRIKQTDYDGRFSFSDVKKISIDKLIEILNVYPNPTNNSVTIEGDLNGLNIYNVFGQNITSDIPQEKMYGKVILNLSNLSNGIYYIRTKNSSSKIIKQ